MSTKRNACFCVQFYSLVNNNAVMLSLLTKKWEKERKDRRDNNPGFALLIMNTLFSSNTQEVHYAQTFFLRFDVFIWHYVEVTIDKL